MTSRSRVSLHMRRAMLAAAIATLATGCATTQQVEVSRQVAQGSCAFLGSTVCSKLSASETPRRFSSATISGSGESVAGLR